MKRTSFLLWSMLLLFVGLTCLVLSTGTSDSFSGSFLDSIRNGVENLVGPIFRR